MPYKDLEKRKQYNKEYQVGWKRRWRAKYPEKSRASVKLYQARHRDKVKMAHAKYYQRTKEVTRLIKRDQELRRYYGINLKKLKELITSQGGICQLCDRVFDGSTKNLKPHVDHDHKNGRVRGILCHRCNSGLGCFDDSLERLQRAIDYLRKE